jgi:hypothetical protein
MSQRLFLRTRVIGVKKVMDSLEKYTREIITKEGRKVVLRMPREDDVLGLMEYINVLVEEDTFISQNKKVTRKEEERYLRRRLGAVEEKEGFNILAEYKGKIIASGGVERKWPFKRVIYPGREID